MALAAIVLLSLYPVRRFRFELFLKAHFFLSFTTIGSLIWHLLPGDFGRILCPIIALSLWSLNAAFRLWLAIYNNMGERARHQQVRITKYCRLPHVLGSVSNGKVGALKLEVELKREMIFTPGQYVYISTQDLQLRHRFQSRPFAITW